MRRERKGGKVFWPLEEKGGKGEEKEENKVDLLSPGLGSPQSWCPNGCVDRMAAVRERRCGLMSPLPAAIDSSPVLLNQKQYLHVHTPRVSLGQFMNMLATLFPMCTHIHLV